MTIEQTTVFLDLINEAFGYHNQKVRIENGIAEIQQLHVKIGLSNLAQRCAAQPFTNWPAMISEQIARSIAFSPGSPVDFETAKDRLRLRFRSHGYVAGEHFWGRQLAHGLVANLALDWPDRVENVSTPQIKQWGHSAEDLWQIALTNLAREALPQAKRIVIQGPVSTQLSYYLLEGDSMFVASHALRLPNVDTGVARFGWIFMVPNRHTLYFTGIMNLSECGAAAMMLMQCSSSILARPGLLSDQLYWTDGTRFEHLARTERMTGQQVVESIQEALPRFAGAGSGPLTRQ